MSLAVAAAALLGAAALDWTQRARAGKLHVEDEGLGIQVAAIRADLGSVTEESNQLAVRIDRARALGRKRAWSGMIELIGACMPNDCWLTSIATDPDRPAAQRASPRKVANGNLKKEQQRLVTIDAPRGIVIEGYAAKTAQPHAFVASLKKTGVFKSVTLLSSQRESVDNLFYFRFELACGW